MRALCRSVRAICFRAYAATGAKAQQQDESEGESAAADVATGVLGELLALLVAADAKDS